MDNSIVFFSLSTLTNKSLFFTSGIEHSSATIGTSKCVHENRIHRWFGVSNRSGNHRTCPSAGREIARENKKGNQINEIVLTSLSHHSDGIRPRFEQQPHQSTLSFHRVLLVWDILKTPNDKRMKKWTGICRLSSPSFARAFACIGNYYTLWSVLNRRKNLSRIPFGRIEMLETLEEYDGLCYSESLRFRQIVRFVHGH